MSVFVLSYLIGADEDGRRDDLVLFISWLESEKVAVDARDQ